MRSSSVNPSWVDNAGPEAQGGGIEHLVTRLIQQVARGELSRDDSLALLVGYVQALTNADGAAIACSDDSRMVCRASLGSAPDVGVVLRPDAGLSGECIRTAKPAICSDTANDTRVDAAAAAVLGVRSILVVPVMHNGEVTGLVEVFAAATRAFDARHLTALQRLAARLPRLMLAQTLTATGAHAPVEVGPTVRTVSAIHATPDPSSTAVPQPHPMGSAAPSRDLFGESTNGAPASNWRRVALIAAGVLLLLALVLLFTWRYVQQAGANPGPTTSSSPDPEVLFRRARELVGSAGECRSAVELFRQAAQAGHLAAQYQLAVHVRRPECGADASASASWLAVAAERGHAQAQREYASALAEGRGVPRDVISAYAWYVLAQQGGDSASEQEMRQLTRQMRDSEILRVRTRLGSMYAQGTGTARDYVRAYTWFMLAEAGGDSSGAHLRDQLARSMTPEQIGAARNRALEWLRRHPQGERTRIAARPSDNGEPR